MSTRPLTVLVVDDTEAQRYATGRMLRAAGFHVMEAATGQQALAQASSRPDAVLLDIKLPDIDGFEVCRRLRADAQTADIPVVQMSANFVRPDDQLHGINDGADAYVVQPFDPDALVTTLRAAMHRRNAERVRDAVIPAPAPGRSQWFRIAIVTVCYLAASLAARFFVITPQILAPVWPAAGVLLAGLLWLPASAMLPAFVSVLGAGIVGNWITGVPLLASGAFSLANCIGGFIAAALLKRLLGPAPRFDELKPLAWLMLIGAGVANAVGAAVGATVVAGFHFAEFGDAWIVWFLSNAWGILIVVPLASEWKRIHHIVHRSFGRAWIESLIVVAVLAGIAGLAFTGHAEASTYSFIGPFLIFPVLVWAALRFGAAGATLTSMVLTILVLFATTHGLGRFAGTYESLHTRIVELQVLMTAAVICALIPAAVTSERERATTALGHSERRLRNACAAAKMWTWEIEAGTLAITRSAEAFHLGARFDSLRDHVDDWLERVHPEDRARVRTLINTVMTADLPYECDFRLRWRDGSYHWVYSRGAMVTRGGTRYLSGISMDISDRKHDEQALQQSRAEADTRLKQLRATVDSLSEAVYVCDPGGSILLTNPAFSQFYGSEPRADRLTMRDLSEAFEVFELNGSEVPVAEWPVSKALRGETVRNREQCVRRARYGDEMIVNCNAAPVRDAAGVVLMAVVSFEDITTAKHAEKALVQSEKLASVGRMAATIAHEINNPLAAAMNAIFLASSAPGMPCAAAANLELAENELERVAHITKQTLGFYRETGNSSAVRLPEVLDGVLDLYAPKLRNKAVAVQRTYASVKPVHAIEGEMRQVVSNLIGNSVDALPANGRLHIRTSNPPGVNGGRPMVRLTIADDGCGIAPENLKRIFEPFFTTKQAIGTGLGLWVTRELVKKHAGRIRVRSRVGRGTVFSIWLPAERRQRDRSNPHEERIA